MGTPGTRPDASTRVESRLGAERSLVQIQSPRLGSNPRTTPHKHEPRGAAPAFGDMGRFAATFRRTLMHAIRCVGDRRRRETRVSGPRAPSVQVDVSGAVNPRDRRPAITRLKRSQSTPI